MNQFAFAFDSDGKRPRLPESDLPAPRLDRLGASALSDAELLTLALQGAATPLQDAQILAHRLLHNAGNLAALLSWSADDFRLAGISERKAAHLLTTVEIGRRMFASAQPERPVLTRPEAVFDHLRPTCTGLDIEKFFVLSLNRKNRLIRATALTSGTADATLAHPRDVFRQAIRDGACGVIVAHNHPSGDPAPSSADVQLTRRLREASRTVDIELLDHVICGLTERDPNGRGFYSFRESGLL